MFRRRRVLYNHIVNNREIGNKRLLYENMCAAGFSHSMPESYVITHKLRDKLPPNCLDGEAWILKPGENFNQGQQIEIYDDGGKIHRHVQDFFNTMAIDSSLIIQRYVANPLLYNGRKFDIRTYGLIQSTLRGIKGYIYRGGYLRTSQQQFTNANLCDKYVHLTNDAIQKNGKNYGRYESANKVTYSQFEAYLKARYCGVPEADFRNCLLPTIERQMTQAFQSVSAKLDPLKRANSFEIFGFDFMITANFRVYLIEVNSNPAMDTRPGDHIMAQMIP